MKSKDSKPGAYLNKSSKIVPMTLMFIVLCGFSFYLGGIYCSEKDGFLKKDVTPQVQPHRSTSVAPLQIKSVTFPECSSDYQDYTPCTDPKVLFLISNNPYNVSMQ